MHVLVLGAGVTGVTTAWFLREAGFDVSVVDRQPCPAQETSFANGGQISISHPEPWSSPSAPWIALRSLGRADAPLHLNFSFDAARWRWMLAFLRECLPARHHRNADAIAALAVHSGACLRALRARTGLHYEERTRGILHLVHTRAERRAAEARLGLLARHGIDARVVEPEACCDIDPALSHIARQLAGGIYAPGDESGNARLFSESLAGLARERGVDFRFSTRIEGFNVREGELAGVDVVGADGTAERLVADRYVMCLGPHGAQLAQALGESLPIYPVKGYSVSVPVIDPARAPTVSLTDESRRIVCSRLGDQLRVAGTAELAGFDLTPHRARCEPLLDWIDELFPGGTRREDAELWAGLRPCTPSYVPVIGRSRRHPALWFNTGHGSLGWTLSCGSADLLTALMRGRPAPVAGFPLYGA